ncbi:MAG: hypothetical protein OXQ29_03535 [Rhodospirillaceae bacterium]|nr:hypothetical protein [Rhodospirillaceae bacterium]
MTGYIVTRDRDGQTYQAGAVNVSDTTRDDHPFVMDQHRAERLAEFLSSWDDGQWHVAEAGRYDHRWTGRRDGS